MKNNYNNATLYNNEYRINCCVKKGDCVSASIYVLVNSILNERCTYIYVLNIKYISFNCCVPIAGEI